MKKITISAMLLAASFNVNAALLDGETVTYQYYFPSTTSPYSNAANGDYVVGAGVEISNVADNQATLDISDTNLYIDYSNSSTWATSAFNGFTLTDTFDNIAAFTSVSINAATNLVGFDLSRISLLDNVISVNWQGLSFNENTVLSLDINSPSQVPVPAAAFLFAPALLGFLGLRRKAKTHA